VRFEVIAETFSESMEGRSLSLKRAFVIKYHTLQLLSMESAEEPQNRPTLLKSKEILGEALSNIVAKFIE
jgi:hypothetical protein